jgi:hypothetical protein
MSDTFVLKGKGVSKADRGLVESIMAGEMRNAWQSGDGKDYRAERQSWISRDQVYRENYERIFGHD